jgi:DNA-binding response OmpR family regulator
LAFGTITVDLDMHTARVDGQVLDLTRREFELLAYFLANPRRILTREKILQQVWGLEYLGESRTIDAHVRRVRAKLGPVAAEQIETVVGVGYRLGGPSEA